MTCRSKTRCGSGLWRNAGLSRFGRCSRGAPGAGKKGFTLPEAVAALVILAFFSSGVLVVINRCMAWASDSAVRMRAFEVARENMEKLLSSDSLKEMSEYGDSEKYPGIKWQTDVETFYEPITSRMWVRGVCTAQYEDAAGEEQTIELTHWLTNLTKEQLLALAQRDEKEKAMLAGQVLVTIEDAAAYAGVDVATVEKWIDNGMLTLEDGSFVKQNIDLYKNSGGSPTAEQVQTQVQSEAELVQQGTGQEQGATGEQGTEMTQDEWLDKIDPTTGLTNREVDQMSIMDLFDLLMKRANMEP
jgi:type II secretory pathway component PulJ